MNENILRLIMKYLKTYSLIDSFLLLQKQAKLEYQNYSHEICFLKQIIIQGQFDEAIHYLDIFQGNINSSDLKRLYFCIYKQRFFQLIENPNQIQLRQLLQKDIIPYCNQQQYNSLIQFLPLNNIQDHPQFTDWTIMRGRLKCFQFIRPYIQSIEQYEKNIKQNNDTQTLEEIVNNYYKNRQLKKSNHKYNHTEYKLETYDIDEVKSTKSNIVNLKKNNYVQIKSNLISSEVLLLKQQQQQLPKNQFENQQNQSSLNGIDQYSVKSIKQSNKNLKVLNSHDDINQINKNKSIQIFKIHPPQKETSIKVLPNKKFTRKFAQTPKIKQLATIKDSKPIRVSRFSNNHKYLALGTLGSAVKIFDIEKIFKQKIHTKISQLNAIYSISGIHQRSVFYLDWSKKQNRLVSCSNDNSIKLIRFEEEFSKFNFNLVGRHQAPVRMAKFNSFQNSIISCSEDTTIRIWDIEKVKPTIVLRDLQTINCIKILDPQDDNLILSCGKDCKVKLWDIRTGKSEITSKLFNSEITYIADHTENIVISQKNGYISFLNKQLNLISDIQVHTDQIRSIDGNPLEKSYLTSSFDGRICVLTQNKQQLERTYWTHNNNELDNVIYATFYKQMGLVSCSKLGICNLYSLK